MTERYEFNIKERQDVVQALWNAVNNQGYLLKELPRIIRTTIETEAWKEREVDGKIVRFERFADFITTNPREGCGWEPAYVSALIKDDPATLTLWRDAITPKKHLHHDDAKDDGDNITINKTIKPERGTSKSYLVSRLKRVRPDLFERVCNDELSVHAAAIAAGFIKPKLSPLQQIFKLIAKLTPEELDELLDRIGGECDGDDVCYQDAAPFHHHEQSEIPAERSDNAVVKEKKKRNRKGKLSPEQNHEVIRRIQSGEKQRALAEEFGVSQTTISNIIMRNTK